MSFRKDKNKHLRILVIVALGRFKLSAREDATENGTPKMFSTFIV